MPLNLGLIYGYTGTMRPHRPRLLSPTNSAFIFTTHEAHDLELRYFHSSPSLTQTPTLKMRFRPTIVALQEPQHP